MTEAKPRKLPLHTTPKGRFQWPRLVVPDTKFDKDGRYSVGLIVSAEDAEPLVKTLGALHAEAVAQAEAAHAEKVASLKPHEAKKVKPVDVNPYFEEERDEDGAETGNLVFRFSAKAKGVTRKKGKPEEFTRKIAIFDAKGNMIRDDTLEIWSGTVGRITFVAVPYYVPATGATGLSLRPVAAQVIELRTRGSGKSASQFGFDAEDGGYAYERPEASAADEPKGDDDKGLAADDDDLAY